MQNSMKHESRLNTHRINSNLWYFINLACGCRADAMIWNGIKVYLNVTIARKSYISLQIIVFIIFNNTQISTF